MRAIVVDEELRPVPAGEVGELLLAGPQVTLGYWQDAEQTAKAFVVPPDEHEVFYRTGDRVRWPSGRPLTYLGRVDNQLKIQGYRVELGEIEAVLREASQSETVVVGWPVSAIGAEGLVAFVQAPVGLTVAEKANFCESLESVSKRRLPVYMQPARVLLLDEFPLNANGKVDRRALRALLDTEGSSRVQSCHSGLSEAVSVARSACSGKAGS
jgi:acyl-coenzyme A synthetase/AMP-(fatty) acid ligase